MKKIQIHCINADGSKAIMNHLSGENTAVSDPNNKKLNREKLLEHATKMAASWGTIYPHDQFIVVEV